MSEVGSEINNRFYYDENGGKDYRYARTNEGRNGASGEQINAKIEKMDEKMDARNKEMDEKMDARMGKMDEKIDMQKHNHQPK